MGQAIARTYLGAGYSVTVWNRTKRKAEALGKEGGVFEPYVMDFLGALPWFFKGLASEVDSGKYSGEENSLAMMAAGAVHVAHTTKAAGVNTALTDLISELFQKTVANGHGKDELTSVIEVLKK